jgi:hypothetical protein
MGGSGRCMGHPPDSGLADEDSASASGEPDGVEPKYDLHPHLSSNRFASIDGAGIAAARQGLIPSVSSGFEYGGWIVKVGRLYTYTVPVTFHQQSNFWHGHTSSPRGPVVAGYHTHPDRANRDGIDAGDVGVAEAYRMPTYVGIGADGSVEKWSPPVPFQHFIPKYGVRYGTTIYI